MFVDWSKVVTGSDWLANDDDWRPQNDDDDDCPGFTSLLAISGP